MTPQELERALKIVTEWVKPTENVVDCVKTEYIQLVSQALLHLNEENKKLLDSVMVKEIYYKDPTDQQMIAQKIQERNFELEQAVKEAEKLLKRTYMVDKPDRFSADKWLEKWGKK